MLALLEQRGGKFLCYNEQVKYRIQERDIMPAAATATRQNLYHLIERLPDEKIPILFDWVSRLGGGGGQSTLLSFNPEPDPFYSASNMAVLQQSIRDADEGRLTAHELIDA